MDSFQLNLPKRTLRDRLEDLFTDDQLAVLDQVADAGGVTPGTVVALVVEEFLLSVEKRIIENAIVQALSVKDLEHYKDVDQTSA